MNNELITRLVYKGEVYYRLKDIAELRGVSLAKLKRVIASLEIPTCTIDGFGRTLWILEKHVADIKIDEQIIVMRTELKDYQNELKTTYQVHQLGSVFFGKEVDLEKVLNEVEATLDNFTNENNKRAEEYENKIRLWNELFEKYGIQERYCTLSFVVENEIYNETFMIDGEGEIVRDNYDAIYSYIDNEETYEIISKEVEQGFYYYENEIKVELHFGKPFEYNNEYLVKKYLDIIANNPKSMESTDWIDMELSNGNKINIDIDMFIKMLNNDIKIIG